jgi:hypothetical protein
MRRRALLIACVAAGCGNAQPPPTNGQFLAGFTPPDAPQNGFQIVLPIVHDLQPGSDTEMCTWTNMIADKEIDVKAVQAYQSLTGHHVVLYTTKVQQPAGTTRVCTDDDMATFRFAAGAGGEGQAGLNQAPGDLVYVVPAGYQVVLNHHYINATSDVHDAQSVMNVYYADPGQKYVPSSSLVFVDTAMVVPPGGPSGLDINCTMQNPVNAWFAIPHMHAYGTHISVDHIHGGVTDNLFDVKWTPAYTFHPPAIRKEDPTQAIPFAVGDQVHVHCDWENDTTKSLTFGIEMCVFFAATVDANGTGNLACDSGAWGDF